MRVRALRDRKERRVQGLFVVEGHKVVGEAYASGADIVNCFVRSDVEVPAEWRAEVVASAALERMSSMRTAPGVLAVVRYAPPDTPEPAEIKLMLERQSSMPGFLALDGLSDPGNMGALMRSAEWFGFAGILVSPQTVDAVHPKVVQAAMGSSFRVPVWEVELPAYLSQVHAEGVPVVGFDMHANSMYADSTTARGILVVGSESHGVSPEVKAACSELCFIPGRGRAESLNAAIAGSIAMSEWHRRS